MTRSLHAVVALLATLAALVVAPDVPARATPGEVDVIAAEDAVTAAVEVSRRAFPDGAGGVVLASAANFPDALAASAVSTRVGGPILFTDPDGLPRATATELHRLLAGSGTVHVMGGEAAIDDAVIGQLQDRGYAVARIAGATRLETAAAAAELVGIPDGGTVVVARAFGPGGAGTTGDRTTGWVDAVACGAWAAAEAVPVLLTEGGRLSAPTRDTIEGSQATRAVVCGGTGAVGEQVVTDLTALGLDVDRVAGPTRVETAVAVARTLFGHDTAAGQEFVLVPGSGEQFAFGLAAAPLAGRLRAPILLAGSTEPTSCDDAAQPSRETLCYLGSAGGDPAGLTVVGGPGVLARGVVSAAARAAGATLPTACDPAEAVQPSDVVSQPTVEGPIGEVGIRTGRPYGATLAPLPPGWVEEEFFFAGTARSYGASPGEREYRQKILVRRPIDPAAFNGTVVFDWNNVTIPHDRSVAWNSVYDTVYRRGFAFVSVSAQLLGTEGTPTGLKLYDPVRYGSLSHPGDDYSWDIFSQAAEAAITEQVMGELVPCIQRRIATGASQSGGRVKDYITLVQEESGIFDGFMPTITGSAGVPRDLVPILWVNSQGEVGISTDEPDSDLFRLWEVSGLAHTNYHGTSYQTAWLTRDHSGGLTGEWDAEEAGAWGYQAAPGDCLRDNYHPSAYAWSAALVTLDGWLRTGEAPDPQPRAARDDGGALQFDEHGNLLGGIRTPVLDVPIASYAVGLAPAPGAAHPCEIGGGAAPLRGLTRIFDAATLAELYPTPEAYLTAFEAAVREVLAAGWVLPEGAEDLRRRAVDAAAFIPADL